MSLTPPIPSKCIGRSFLSILAVISTTSYLHHDEIMTDAQGTKTLKMGEWGKEDYFPENRSGGSANLHHGFISP